MCLVKVVGLDYCGLMIAAAQKLQSGNAVEYNENRVARIPLGEGVDHNQVQFVQVYVHVCMLYHMHVQAPIQYMHKWNGWIECNSINDLPEL